MSEPHICMCMEFMDKSSLDTIWKMWGPIPPEICGQVAVVVVEGLTYLYEVHRIIHRGELQSRHWAEPAADSPSSHSCRRQAFEYPRQLGRPDQTLRLWCIRRTRGEPRDQPAIAREVLHWVADVYSL